MKNASGYDLPRNEMPACFRTRLCAPSQLTSHSASIGLDESAPSDLCEDRVGILAVAVELCLPFDVAPELPVVIDENLFGLALRDQDGARAKALASTDAVRCLESQLDETFIARIDVDGRRTPALFDESIDDTQAGQHF